MQRGSKTQCYNPSAKNKSTKITELINLSLNLKHLLSTNCTTSFNPTTVNQGLRQGVVIRVLKHPLS